MTKRKQFITDKNSLTEIVEYIEENLKAFGIKQKECIKALLTVEEAAGSLIEHCDANASDEKLTVIIKKSLGNISIELSAKGADYPLADDMASASLTGLNDEDEGIQDSIRNILLGSLANDLKYKHHNGINYIKMTLFRSKRAFLYQTLGAMFAAIILGLIFSLFVPSDINTFINKTILVRIKTMYMNSLKMVVAPVVFFSIVSCIVQFSDLSSLGRIGGKIIGIYLCTTAIAIGVGIGIFYLIAPGNMASSFTNIADASSITSQTMEVSILDTIVGIVPSDIINPFLKANMLQLIFMAVLCGIATGMLGKYSQNLTDLFNACNDLFLKITTLIIKLMPVAVFCSIMSMVITMGIETILGILKILGVFIVGLFSMMIIYCLLILILGRLNPIPFVKKYCPVMLQVFSMASSNASIPVNMDACEKKLGIGKKVFSLSIPIGATINMDGTCVYLSVFALCLARAYGVDISGSAMLSMIISIFVLSIGAPGIPGSGLICLSVLLTQMNVPVEAVGIIMGIDSLCGMFRTMSNCLGDVAVSTIVAKSEGELDIERYNRT